MGRSEAINQTSKFYNILLKRVMRVQFRAVMFHLFNTLRPQYVDIICSRIPYNTCNNLFKNKVESDRRNFVHETFYNPRVKVLFTI